MIKANHVYKSFGSPQVDVLKDICLEINDGEFVSLTGRSGSGKSTLLYVISTLDDPSKGEVIIDGKNVATLSSETLHRFRNQHMGFVFQFHYLLPELTALENILMPTRKTHRELKLKHRAMELLDHFGIADKCNHLPSQLSGGQTQRVAIARALIDNPRYLFADEPTGNLDSKNTKIVMDIFKKINKEQKTTILFVTHDPDFADLADRKIVLVDGVIENG